MIQYIGGVIVNNKMVEMTLVQILELDKKGQNLKTRIQDTSRLREKELKKLFRKMEFDVMRSARKEAKKEYKAIVEEAESIEKEMIEDKNDEMESLKNVLDKKSESLINELFHNIFQI